MIKDIATIMILGKALTFWLGALTLLLLISTALIPTLNRMRLAKIPMKFHFWLARATIGVALTHALLVISIYLGF